MAEAELSPRYQHDAFFARAAERLNREPSYGAERFLDHDLNGPRDDLPPGGLSFRDAAVLIPIVDRRPEPGVILTQRTSHLPSHAGQVAFPGGKIDPGDAGPGAAAIREAWEEIGLDPALVEPLGYLDTYLTGVGYRVFPMVARIGAEPTLTPNPDEVAAVFEVPLSFLMEPENHALGSLQRGGRERRFYEMPYGDYRIWGMTAGIIRHLYVKLFG